MAPKRLKKSCTKEDNSEKYKNLSINDVLCPICRSILIEPVTLPCNHNFCLACFNGTMENTTLTCPLCRTRIGSWLRSSRKANKIINNELWQVIELKFSNEVWKRRNGEDCILEDSSKVKIKLADPGEIRQEYELQLARERSEIQKERDSEQKASEIIIKKILQEEQEAVRIEKEKLCLDEEIAKRLAAEEKTVLPSVSQKSKVTKSNSKKSSIDRYLITVNKKSQESKINNISKNKILPQSTATSNKEIKNHSNSNIQISQNKLATKNHKTTIMCQTRSKPQCSKAFQHLLLTKTLHCERSASNESDSGDSIKQEMRYFKPIRLAPSVDKSQDGQILRKPLLKLPTVHASYNLSASIRSPQITRTTPISAHPMSAFVSLNRSPSTSSVPCNIVTTVKQPSVISRKGKIIKQYYNKKRSTLFAVAQPCTTISPVMSPFLGFETQNEFKHITILNDFIKGLSQRINDDSLYPAIQKENVQNYISTNNIDLKQNINLTKYMDKTPKTMNGYKPVEMLDATDCLPISDVNIQEQLDFEFAKKLHEELNNTRQTRASLTNKNSTTKTRASPRKRQVTLDELLSPKKFKI